MRRGLVMLALVAVALSAFAQESTLVFEKPFRPMSPVVVGQGGSFTANGSGWDAFFTNPAALAGKGSLTLATVTPWLYSTGQMLDFAMSYAGIDTSGSLMGSVRPRAIVVELPPGFVPPEGYTGTVEDLEAELAAWLDEALAELDPATAELLDGTVVTIPASWTEVDLTDLDAIDQTELQGLVQDFLVENPAVLEVLGDQALADILPPGFPAAPKLRVGVAAGVGLIVKGFGLGMAAIVDADVAGTSVMATSGDATATIGFMAGYAHDFKLSDRMGLKVGGLLRPMFRVNAPLRVSALIGGLGPDGFDYMALLDTLYANYGTGVGIDLGAIMYVGPFSVGLTVTDLFDTRFNYRSSDFVTMISTLESQQTLPVGSALPATEKHVIPMDVRVGAAFHPDLGGLSFLIDPTIHAEVANFLPLARKVRQARDEGRDITINVGDVVAFGAEVRLLRFLKLRAGYYQGAVSAGIGAKLLFLDANVAAYIAPGTGSELTGDETLAELGDVGVTAEFAIRF